MTTRARLLVVDDDEAVRRSYSASLAGSCDARVARDGTEALEEMERNRYDVVLLDLKMPGADGMAVLETIKQRWPECEVVIITGYPSVDTAKQAVRLGAGDYLAKPVGPDEVISAAFAALLRKRYALRH